jgi:peptidyl-tRNA hydrolase, PTH1 family
VKLVCGLGNPGTRYARTRHNAGFMAVEAFGEPLAASYVERWQARTARVSFRGQDVLLVMPLTFMNLSGLAVAAAARFLGIEPADVLIVHDDVDLPLGRIQVKDGGGDGGHNGIRSVTEQLGTRDFPRIRVGVGRPDSRDPEMVDHVLSPFTAEEVVVLDAALKKAVEGIQEWVFGGVPKAQNRVNRRERPVEPSCPVGAAPAEPRDQKKEG